MLIVILAILGLCAGSFVNALVWRIHEQSAGKKSKKLSILKGHSMCPDCRHELAARDLIPLISWLFLRGKCRYCRQPISIQYPIVELTAAAVFVSSYFWWSGDLSLAGQKLLFTAWLISSIGLLALLVYDLKWMLLPNKIIYSTLVVSAIGRLGYIIFFADNKTHSFWLLLLSIIIASGLFWALYIYSKGRWIGFGDVRLGLITGTLLADPGLAFAMIFAASVLGTLFALPELASGQKNMSSRIPFGPFLITATYIMVLVGERFNHWYSGLLG